MKNKQKKRPGLAHKKTIFCFRKRNNLLSKTDQCEFGLKENIGTDQFCNRFK